MMTGTPDMATVVIDHTPMHSEIESPNVRVDNNTHSQWHSSAMDHNKWWWYQPGTLGADPADHHEEINPDPAHEIHEDDNPVGPVPDPVEEEQDPTNPGPSLAILNEQSQQTISRLIKSHICACWCIDWIYRAFRSRGSESRESL